MRYSEPLQFGVGQPSTLEVFNFASAYGDGSNDNTDPRVFVNILIFDRNYTFVDVAYQQLTSSGAMNATYTIKQPGYAFVYVSNEQSFLRDVYFDDITITQTPSPVIQQEDFYPFGLTFNSYFDDITVTHTLGPVIQQEDYYPGGAIFNSYYRENSVPQKDLYNSKEYQDDLNLNLFNVHARQYDPWILRTTTLDPHADRYHNLSSYSWCANNPVLNIDPTGKDVIFDITRNKKGEITGVNLRSTVIITGEGASGERAGELNKAASYVFKSRTLNNGVKVSFDIKYQYKKDFNEKELKPGDNLLNFVNKTSSPNIDKEKSNVSHVKDSRLFSSDPLLFTAENKGEIYKEDWNDNLTIFHETLHFAGLSDRYHSGKPDRGFLDDIMGNYGEKKIGYDHYQAFYNVANEMPSWYPPYQRSFVNRSKVDIDPNTGLLIPPSQQQLKEVIQY